MLVLSASAMASSHVAREVERAASKRKQIIAFRVDAAPLTPALEYFLSESQWIDVPALGMPAALKRLAEAVAQVSTTSSGAGGGIPNADTSPARRPLGVTKSVGIAALVAIMAIGLGVAIYFWQSKHRDLQASAAAISDKSIAVLPFTDMSEKKDQEYFGDGMAEEILDLLRRFRV